MIRLQYILEMLCDGKCNSLDKLQIGTRLNEDQIRAALAFLTEYGFAEITKNNEVRINNAAKKLFSQTIL